MHFQLKKKGFFLITLTALFFFLLSPLAAQLQGSDSGQENAPSFEDSELEKFADVMQEIQSVQTESNQKIEDAISDSSMSKQRFNTLYRARQNEEQQKAEDETSEETEEFRELSEEIQTIQQNSQQQMVETVRENDMTVQEFNQIVKAMRENPELGQRIQEMM